MATGRSRGIALLAVLVGGLGLGGAATLPASPPAATPIWAVQLNWEDGSAPWPASVFTQLAAQGITSAEINLEWGEIEPRQGQFRFGALDADLAGAASAHVQLIPIFWESVWTGNPAPWAAGRDVLSSGALSAMPSWWNPQVQSGYFDYVAATIAHIRNRPGFGGAFLDYGWLDAAWGPPPQGATGIAGYSTEDVARFHQWLPTRYGTLRRFNREQGTDFAAWADVPAARPGQALFAVYQAFRAWSVEDTYARLTALVRRETSAPLYYYWGGDVGQAGQFMNLPDTYFQLARRYRVTVVLDDAEETGLALLFGSLARAYGVRLLQEWTPAPQGLAAEAAQWLGHANLGAPNGAGLDFFEYGGGPEFQTGYPEYLQWIGPLAAERGAYPQQPVAVYVSFAGAFQDAGALAGISAELGALWRQAPTAFRVVTDREVAAGLVRLSQFRAVLPLTGDDAAVRAYAAGGGRVVSSGAALRASTSPYLTFDPAAGVLEAAPEVDIAADRAWISVAEVSPEWPYSGSAEIHYAGLGLPDRPHHLVQAGTGQPIAARTVPGGLEVPLDLASGALAVWELLPGPAAAGAAPVQAAPPAAGASVTAVAGQPAQGLDFLEVGAGTAGGDGSLQLVASGGQPAISTETLAQLGTGGAFVYLQLDPSSAVHAAARVRVAVTYLATPGQGFQVQYDGARGAYENGPAVVSPGSGAWTTAEVTLGDARFAEAQNWSADLRLAVRDGTRPLLVRRVQITASQPSISS